MNNNPGIDMQTWKDLRRKWTELDEQGHSLRVEFQLIAHPQDAKEILAIDVVQHIDGQPVTETVQRRAGEAYPLLGLAGLGIEQLAEACRGLVLGLAAGGGELVLSMRPTSPASGELRAWRQAPGAAERTAVRADYRHYYALSALRDRMAETFGEPWGQVTLTCRGGRVTFQFG